MKDLSDSAVKLAYKVSSFKKLSCHCFVKVFGVVLGDWKKIWGVGCFGVQSTFLAVRWPCGIHRKSGSNMNGFFWPQLPSKITLEITIFGKLWGKLLTGIDVSLLLFLNYNPLLVQLFQWEIFFNISSWKYKKNFWGFWYYRVIPKFVIFLFPICDIFQCISLSMFEINLFMHSIWLY